MRGKPFEPGHIGGGGRPRGAKNKLHRSFIEALRADFDQHGRAVIAIVRVERPDVYLRVIASILPRELEVSQGPSDSDIEEAIASVKALLAAPVERPLMIEHEHVRERETVSAKTGSA